MGRGLKVWGQAHREDLGSFARYSSIKYICVTNCGAAEEFQTGLGFIPVIVCDNCTLCVLHVRNPEGRGEN